MIHVCVLTKRQKKRGKIDMRSNFHCFIEYTDTNTMHKIWNFERKRFEKSHDLIFEESQFSTPKHFDEPSADVYNSQLIMTSTSSPESFPESQRQIYNEIVVQLSSALQVFKTYKEYQSDNDPPSFADAMRRPDANL